MNQLQMVDISSHNTITSLQRLYDSGVRVLAPKASEGTNYVWDRHAKICDTWHSFGGFINHYHFMHPGGTPEAFAEAELFYRVIKDHVWPFDLITVDAETHGESNAEVGAFIDRMVQHFPHIRGLEYSYAAFLNETHIGPHDHWGLWVAGYGSSSAPSVPAWKGGYTAWQYTDAGTVPGISGHVDISHLQRRVVEPTLHRNDANFAVLNAKRAMRKMGLRGFVTDSPVYGGGTANAVAKIRKTHRLNGDGNTLGPAIWRILHRYM